jgi:UDP-N-acetylglucosamine--dolichyl-phosphate N-acetylglucosaminephosphotransferase
MLNILLFYIFFPFFLTILLIKIFQPILKKHHLVGIDQQKINKPVLPSSAGIPVFISILISLLFIFLFSDYNIDYKLVFLALGSIFLVFLIGFLDDIKIEKKKKRNIYGDNQLRVGLPQWLKPLLTAFIFIPLIFIVKSTIINIPFYGQIDIGILYYFLIFILFLVFSNSTNMLAGMNGLEGSLMFIISFTLSIATLMTNEIELFIISLAFMSASIGYLIFNWYPAKILPGDSLTYLFGGYFATIIVFGKLKVFGLFIFLPWFVEILLKLRGKLKTRSLGNVQKDGSLKPPYKHIYSWTHVFMYLPKLFNKNAKVKEWQITLYISILVFIFCIIGLVILF